jgi:hypothetical protein
MKRFALAVVLAAAGSAAAQNQDATPAQPPAEPKELNIRLAEPIRPQPRIDFGPRDDKAKQPQQPADTLPTLGGPPNRALERPLSPDAPGSPFPKDTNPNTR